MYSDSLSQHSSFGTPSQSASTRPVAKTTVQALPGQTGFFVVGEGPRAGIFPDPAMAASEAAGTARGMYYAATRQDTERILKTETAGRPVSTPQSTAEVSVAPFGAEDEAQSSPRQDRDAA